eukprot:m.83288 g.83288  ORF g.83288 m.83288 type:complete len:166 (+) comp16340_c0_seq50:187-684(+)
MASAYGLKVDADACTLEISSESDAARLWTKRGFIWSYAYYHEEAVRCFQKALECAAAEATFCPLAAFGIAFCNGANYNNSDVSNKPGDFPSNADALKYARMAADMATCLPTTSPIELELISAINARVCPTGTTCGDPYDPQRAVLNNAYVRTPHGAQVMYLSRLY